MLALIATTAILIPALIWLIYKPERWKLVLDVVVLALAQVGFSAFALHGLHQGHPAWVVFVKDDFRIVRWQDVPASSRNNTLPPTTTLWTAAQYASDPTMRQKQIQEEIFSGLPIEHRPEAFVPLSSLQAQIKDQAKPLDALYAHNPMQAIQQALFTAPTAKGWLPLKGFEQDGVVFVDAAGAVLTVATLRPWD